MFRKILFIAVLCSSLFTLLPLAAQDDGDDRFWWNDLVRIVTIQRQIPPNILRGLSFNSGGGGSESACESWRHPGSRTGIWVFKGRAEYTNANLTLSPFSTFSNLTPLIPGIDFDQFPAICSSHPFTSAFAVSPSEQQFPSNMFAQEYAKENTYGVRLPIEAYSQPGWWRLVSESSQHYEISIFVPEPNGPFYIAHQLESNSAGSYRARYLIGGFAPYERVVGFLFANQKDFSDEYNGHFELNVNDKGYAVFEVDSPDLVVILGQYGTVRVVSHGNGFSLMLNANGTAADQDDLRNMLYETYWGLDGLGDPINYFTFYDAANEANCTNAPPARLYNRTHARVMPGDPNNIDSAPESGTILGQISAGAIFTILHGPICHGGTHLRWWNVEYNGIVGWLAEGNKDDYWLEP